MTRPIRMLVGISLLTGISVMTLVGMITGWFQDAVDYLTRWWDGVVAWVSGPMSFEHLLAGAGFLVVPLVVLAVMFTLTER